VTQVKKDLLARLNDNPLIASVKEEKNLEKAIASETRVVFLLTGNISVVKGYVDLYRRHDMLTFLHMEKIGGLSFDREGLEFVANFIKPAGIISTKKNILKAAKKLNLMTIQRLFFIDSDAVKNGIKAIDEIKPDAVEVMPARIPELITTIATQTKVTIITGGLLENRKQMIAALEHGARAVSTGTPDLWKERLV
jgi:glycerol uptake operon antiterminator